MGKIVNGVANDFEFDINDYNMFPPNVEKVIITKENYNRLFKGLEEENMFLREKIKHYEKTITFRDYVEELNTLIDYKERIDKAIEYIEKYYDEWMHSGEFISVIESNNRILDILKGE